MGQSQTGERLTMFPFGTGILGAETVDVDVDVDAFSWRHNGCSWSWTSQSPQLDFRPFIHVHTV